MKHGMTLSVLFVAGLLVGLEGCASERAAHGMTVPSGPPALVQLPASGIRKLNAPVKCGEFRELSGDAHVMRDGTLYRMFCTGLDREIMGGGIAQATSTDGLNWETVPTGSEKTGKGLVLRGRTNQWDHQLETAHVIKVADGYLLYFSGYPKVGWPTNPGQIGVAKSADGLNFQRLSEKPALAPSPRGYDANGLYSPVVFRHGGRFAMIYAGHNYKTTAVPAGIYVLAAVSDDGLNWQKMSTPVLSASDRYPFTRYGVAEPDLLAAPDGRFYLFFTGALGDSEKRLIAVASADSPFGPYRIRPTPLLEATPSMYDHKGVLAPSVILEGDRLRMWYLTSDGDKHMTGYAEIPWPLAPW